MKQLGNLAVVVANNKDCMLQIFNETATIYTGAGKDRKSYSCNVWDDMSIKIIISILNSGSEDK